MCWVWDTYVRLYVCGWAYICLSELLSVHVLTSTLIAQLIYDHA